MKVLTSILLLHLILFILVCFDRFLCIVDSNTIHIVLTNDKIAIKNKPGFIELRKIEVAREIATIISHSSNRVMLDADTLLLNVTEQK